MRGRKIMVILMVGFLIGISLLLYPAFSDFWNSKTQTRAIVNYESVLEQLEPEDYSAIFQQAYDYNKQLSESVVNPLIYSENFPGYAAEDILTAIKMHTTGDENMSTLSKILFVADYVEEGRRYPSSAELRNALYSELAASRNKEEALAALDSAVVASIDFTLTHLESCGKFIHPKTRLTKEAILKKTEDK